MCQAFFDGRVRESCEMQIKYLGRVEALFCDVNPIPAKAALNMMGMNVGGCRLPLCDTTEANLEFIKAKLKAHNLI